MKYTIVGKNISVTEAMKAKIIAKIGQVEKYLRGHEDLECRVLVRVYPDGQKIEVTIPTKTAILRAEVVDRDLYTAIDLVGDKLEIQLRKTKARMNRKVGNENLGKAFALEMIDEVEEKDVLVKTKSIAVDRMDLEEAAVRMEMLGHSFFIFKDSDSGKIAVLYRRGDGALGLIEVVDQS